MFLIFQVMVVGCLLGIVYLLIELRTQLVNQMKPLINNTYVLNKTVKELGDEIGYNNNGLESVLARIEQNTTP